MVITESVIPGARLLGLGLKLYPSNMPRTLNKDLTRVMQSPSRVQQTRVSKTKALLSEWNKCWIKLGFWETAHLSQHYHLLLT